MSRHHRIPRPGGTIQAGPTNVIWLIACDDEDTTLTRRGPNSTVAGWWRYAAQSTPPDAAAGSQIWRMNNTRTTFVGQGADSPDASLTRLAATIDATDDVNAEDMIFYWHGTHVNVAPAGGRRGHAHSQETPIVLRNAAEEYFGALHSNHDSDPLHPRFDLPPERPDWARSRDPDTYDGIVRQRQAFTGAFFPFNWLDEDRRGNDAYMNVIGAMREHPHVKRFHLLGCDLADLRYMKPILDLTEDLASGGPDGGDRVTDKEVWVYNDFTYTGLDGSYLYISHQHSGNTLSKGVRQLDDHSYELVNLYEEHGALRGWQVRGRVDASRGSIVEQYRREPVPGGRRGQMRHVVRKIDAAGIADPARPYDVVEVPVPTPPPRARRRRHH